MSNPVYILSSVRTPIGSLSGSLASLSAPDLGATCIKSAVDRAKLSTDQIDEVIMGNVISAGIGQNPARQAAIHAGLPASVGATSINKVCGSGLKAVMFAAQAIQLSEANVIVAGGMESMTNAPYLLAKARQGYRLGHGELLDSMIHDGLWNIYSGKHMGVYGETCADKFSFTREEQDDFAVKSYQQAIKATEDGIFAKEIVPVSVKVKRETIEVSTDEELARFNEEKLRSLSLVFDQEGTITAGNASSINDGAAALVIASQAIVDSSNLQPIAKIIGSTTFSQEPEWFTTAPIGAINRLLEKLNWKVDEVDLFEINEAFSAVTMAAERELGLPSEKVNPFGGAVAIGHPIGCSGARILVTLITALQHFGKQRGIASLCIGGGEAVAMGIELV